MPRVSTRRFDRAPLLILGDSEPSLRPLPSLSTPAGTWRRPRLLTNPEGAFLLAWCTHVKRSAVEYGGSERSRGGGEKGLFIIHLSARGRRLYSNYEPRLTTKGGGSRCHQRRIKKEENYAYFRISFVCNRHGAGNSCVAASQFEYGGGKRRGRSAGCHGTQSHWCTR